MNILLDLNEYCLEYIVAFLSINDVINLAEADEYLKYVCQRRLSQEKEITINFRFLDNMEKVRKLFHHIGPYLEYMQLNVGYSIPESTVIDVLQEIINSCKKVCNLKINNVIINDNHIQKLIEIVPQLIGLDLGESLIYVNPNEMFSKCEKLQHLKLIVIDDFSFEGIASIKTLKTLNVIKFTSDLTILDFKNLRPDVELKVIQK